MDRLRPYLPVFTAVALSVILCSSPAAAAPSPRGASPAQAWPSYGNTATEQRFSPLNEINTANAARIGLDWALDMPDAISFVSTPLMVDGVLYFSGDRAIVRAVDARTGRLLWTYDPEVGKHAPRSIALGWNSNRGIAYENGRVFVGATDGRLVALDAKSGQVQWATRTFPEGSSKAITGAPRAFNGRVFIGHGGADFGTRGYIDAYDAVTGRRLWRFHTVPGNPADGFESRAMEMAAGTWRGQWWKQGGGGTVWGAITYDSELNLVYFGVGNGSPWNRGTRSEGQGDNLFLCSIVAVRADTGEYVWHYQTNPGEEWDYKATADIVLADLVIGGKVGKVLMQAPTNGFYYVIDRATGKLLSAEKFERVNWAERIDLVTGRPVEADFLHPAAGGDTFEMWPGPWGAHNWQAMSFNPQLGLTFIPTMHMPARWSRPADAGTARDRFFNFGMNIEHPTDPKESSGGLLAWDPVAQKARWQVTYDAVWNGGTLATAGNLVFQGTAEGDFYAYDARSGKRLWRFDAQRGISAAPISYSLDGRQHVAVLVGWGGLASFGSAAFMKHGWKYRGPGIRLLSFSLDGKAALPKVDARRFALEPVDTGTEPIDEKSAALGLGIYHGAACATCHGVMGQSAGGAGPDLRESAILNDYRVFRSIVAEGALLSAGMPMFDDLGEQEIRGIFDFLRQQTRVASRAAPRP
jgi:quinohemoprotein ethanol dehydrogenase